MSLVHYKPVNLFNQFNDEMNRHFSTTRAGAANQEHGWLPAVDIREEDTRYLINADVPGINSKDIEITLEDGVLSIKGERNTENIEESENYRRVERQSGQFYRRFTLPDSADADKIEAKSEHGVLRITIPKQEVAVSRRIEVKH